MASIIKQPNGRKAIQWTDADGNRPMVRLGKINAKAAGTIRSCVEDLVHSQITGEAPSKKTSEWVAGLGDVLRGRFERAGLLSPRGDEMDGPATLEELWDWFAREHGKGCKPRTMLIWEQSRRSAVGYFGEDKPIADVTPGAVDSFARHLATAPRSKKNKTPLAPNTYRKRLSVCRQVFRAAVRHRWLEENPFADLKGLAVRADKSKSHFLPRADAEKILDACPNAEWRLIFALARFGGLRTPSETLALKWEDVLWDQGKVRVPSPKTAHHDGKEERFIPLFPELRPVLEDAFELSPEGAKFVIGKTRDAGTNWRTTFTKIVRRAGVEPWPRLFANLRASRATELEEQFPGHVVRTWLGHTEAVAREHYLQVTDEHFAAATAESAAESAADCNGFATPGAASSEQPKAKPPEIRDFPGVSYSGRYTRRDSKQVGFALKNAGFLEPEAKSAAECAATDDDSAALAYLRAGWPDAPEEVLRHVLAILNSETVAGT